MTAPCCKSSLADVLDRPGTVLLDDRPPGGRGGVTYLLSDPVDVITADRVEDVPAALERIDRETELGRFVAGYVGYDASLRLDKPIRSRHVPATPLIWLGVYPWLVTLDADRIDLGPADPADALAPPGVDLEEKHYLAAVERIGRYIEAGDVYQVNYTCRLRFENRGTARGLFARLRYAHPVCHAAWIHAGDHQVLSFSPELFLRRWGDKILTRPMKGTIHRGRSSAEDAAVAAALAGDEKNRAENVMIVDLMRNDLGRLCRPGTVAVQNVLQVERYRSLFQMTSEVVGSLRPETSTAQLLRATLPPGSVTGAPKIRAMEILDELEIEARGVYCGAIGLFRPGGDCVLNVAIRTVLQRGRQCEMGAGSGIVADSDPSSEWAEVWLKAGFLAAEVSAFELLETLALTDGHYAWEERHLERMRHSAAYFGWSFPEAELRQTLVQAAAEAGPARSLRLRLLLAEDGACRSECSPLGPAPSQPVTVLLSSRRTDPADPTLYHKTTARERYDADHRAARAQGHFDVLYRNVHEEITEGAIANVAFQIDGQWFTPPLRCGLLPGIRRGEWLRCDFHERVLTLADLPAATAILLGNSVRGDIPIDRLIDAASGETLWRRPPAGER